DEHRRVKSALALDRIDGSYEFPRRIPPSVIAEGEGGETLHMTSNMARLVGRFLTLPRPQGTAHEVCGGSDMTAYFLRCTLPLTAVRRTAAARGVRAGSSRIGRRASTIRCRSRSQAWR